MKEKLHECLFFVFCTHFVCIVVRCCTEVVQQGSRRFDAFELLLFNKVREGSMHSNHSELEYKYPTHLVSLPNLFVEKVQYSRTTQISPLHTLFSPRGGVEPLRTKSGHSHECCVVRHNLLYEHMQRTCTVVRLHRTSSNLLIGENKVEMVQ